MDFLNNVINEVNNDPNIGSPDLPDTFGGAAGSIVNVMLGIAISLSIIFMIVSGIRLIVAQGNPREAETARNALKYSVIAFFLAMFAVTIKYIVLDAIGVVDQNVLNGPNF